MDLPRRKFELGRCVWVCFGEYDSFGRVQGYQDGRDLASGRGYHDGWLYLVRIDADTVWVPEDRIRTLETRGEQ